MIPQSNPKASYISHKEEIDLSIARVLQSGWYVLGQEVGKFENEFARYIGVKYACGVASGTDAIELSLRACEISNGDFVITVSHTASATASAIIRAGAQPLFVDIDPAYYTLDPVQLEHLLNSWKGPLPKAVIPVHLYGHPADMPAIINVAKKYNLYIIEDCAQAHGAEIEGRKVGSWGDIGCFSFYPTKNLGALGDGGILLSSNDKLAEKVTLLREYGWRNRYISSTFGTNSRLDEIQAAILRVKLKYLDKANNKRRNIASYYNENLKSSKINTPEEKDKFKHVFHQYVIALDSNTREDFRIKLKKNGISTSIHYPVPIHLQPFYNNAQYIPLPLKQTESIVSKIVSLPIYPELKDDDIETVVMVINEKT